MTHKFKEEDESKLWLKNLSRKEKRDKKFLDSFIEKRVTVCSNNKQIFQARGILKKEGYNDYKIRENDCYCSFQLEDVEDFGEIYFEESGVLYLYLK